MNLELTNNALLVLQKRLLARDQQGDICETPEQMFRRVATSIASADLRYGASNEELSRTEADFFDAMIRLEFLPNSPTLMNAGRELSQLSACFVLPIEDSMESIFRTLSDTALIQKSGGGTGYSFSNLRPREDYIQSTQGQSSGPVSFMRLYNFATEVTKLGGKRAGANMGILRVDHPDIEEFIASKANALELNTFNISVAVTCEFMEHMRGGGTYDLINPRTGRATKKVDARFVFNQAAEHAWRNGDPGLIFIDRINRDNPTPALGELESTNPCGEQPLLPYESCVLGSINLSRLAADGQIDYERLSAIIETGVHFLDNVIDVSEYPIPQIADITRQNRKIGLGVMGCADLLILLKISYNSEEAVRLGEDVMGFISRCAIDASVKLAARRGPFPRRIHEAIYNNTGLPARRNATITTVAPTGTISLIANCSSGIEPIYAAAYWRRSFESERMLFVHPLFEQYAKANGIYNEAMMERVALTGSLPGVERVPLEAKRLFVTAHEIAPEWHVRMQAAFQRHIDAAVSKTINFAHTATVEDIKSAYMLAWELGCKGITVYRDGSREQQVLSAGMGDAADVTLSPAARREMELPENRLLANNMCPECGSVLRHNGGCLYCTCGYSVCVQT